MVGKALGAYLPDDSANYSMMTKEGRHNVVPLLLCYIPYDIIVLSKLIKEG